MKRSRIIPAAGIFALIVGGLGMIVARLNDIAAIYIGLILFWPGVLCLCAFKGWCSFILARKWRIVLIVVLVLVSIVVLPNLRSNPQTPAPTAESTPPIEEQVVLFERYAEQWKGHQGTQIKLDNTVLSNQFTAEHVYQLTPGITHDIPRTTLTNLTLYLTFPDTIGVQPVKLWQHTDTRFGFKEYSYSRLPPIASGDGQNAAESLSLTFPQAGNYPFTCTIAGDGLNSFKRSFVIRLE